MLLYDSGLRFRPKYAKILKVGVRAKTNLNIDLNLNLIYLYLYPLILTSMPSWTLNERNSAWSSTLRISFKSIASCQIARTIGSGGAELAVRSARAEGPAPVDGPPMGSSNSFADGPVAARDENFSALKFLF